MSEVKFSMRKSLFMSFKKCQQQGVYNMKRKDEGYGELNTEVPALLKGQIFHHAMEDLYNEMDFEKMKGLPNTEIEGYIRSLFPSTTQEDLAKWFDWYIRYEAERFLKMKIDGKLDYFMPYKQEHYVQAIIDGVQRTGHIDRIDRVSEDELIVIEYKTGKSYDPTKAYRLTDMRAELEWYRSILVRLDDFKKFRIKAWKLLNPTLGVNYDAKYSTITSVSVDKHVGEIGKIIDGQKEPVKKIGMQCNWCPFAEECLKYEDVNHEIFGELSKEMLQEVEA